MLIEMTDVPKIKIKVYPVQRFTYREIEQVLGLSSFTLDRFSLHNRLNKYISDKELQDENERTLIKLNADLLKLMPRMTEKVTYEQFHSKLGKIVKN